MPVKITFIEAVMAASQRNTENISRFCISDYAVDETGNNYHGDNY